MNTITRHTYPAQIVRTPPAHLSMRSLSIRALYDQLAAAVAAGTATSAQVRHLERLKKSNPNLSAR